MCGAETVLMRSRSSLRGIALLIAGICLLGAQPSQAKPGDMDRSFGRGGVVSVARPSLDDGPGRVPVAVALDGSVVTALSDRPILKKFTSEGLPDGSFGSDGVLGLKSQGITSIGSIVSGAGGAVLLSVEVRPGSGSESGIARVLADGSLDESFGDSGVAGLGSFDFGERPIAVDSSGRIVVAGNDNALIRLNPDGSGDSAFTPDPILLGRNYPLGAFPGPFYLPTFRPDGRLLVAFHGTSGEQLAQLTDSGALDATFADDGIVQLCCGDSGSAGIRTTGLTLSGSDVLAQVGGCTASTGPGGGSVCRGRLVRLDQAGMIDGEFGSGFRSNPINVNQSDASAGLAADASGRLLVPRANISSESAQPINVTRVLPGGTLDMSFGQKGSSRAFPRNCGFSPYDIQVDALDRPLVSGTLCGRQAVIRLKSTPGPPSDADGDGRDGRRDKCDLYPSQVRRGCPLIERSLRVRRGGHHAIGGRVVVHGGAPNATACLRGRVELLDRSRGGSQVEVISSTKTKRDGSWALSVGDASGRLTLSMTKSHVRNRGVCSGTSRTLSCSYAGPRGGAPYSP